MRGNSIWYRLGDGRWVSARYVQNHGSVSYCDGGNGIEATAVSDVWVLRGPSTADAKEGLWKKGAVAFVSCKVRGQNIGGNTLWYHVVGADRGDTVGWVSARYVMPDATVPFC